MIVKEAERIIIKLLSYVTNEDMNYIIKIRVYKIIANALYRYIQHTIVEAVVTLLLTTYNSR